MSRSGSPTGYLDQPEKRHASRRTAHSVGAKLSVDGHASASQTDSELSKAESLLGMSGGNGMATQALSKLMIDPRASRWISAWDAITGTALMFVALVTPIEVGFLEPTASWLDPLFLVNQVINAVFVVDLVLQFFLMVPITDAFGTRWVSNPGRIAKHYMRGWFGVDLLSIAVSAVDYVSLGNVFEADSQESLDNLRTLRILRALRLVKLSKLLTGQRIIKRWETKVAINYSAISLLKCLVGTLLLSHWFACLWGLQASFAESKINTWLGGYDLCTLAPDGVTEVCKGAGYRYSAAIYWAVMTMTSIGYGDISATPGNIAEHVICTAIMAFGAMFWGMVLGTIVSNLSSLDPDGDKFAQTMSELNMMMMREDLPNDMRVRLREYFQQTVHVRFTQQRSELLRNMSPSLRTEVVWLCNREWLSKIWFLKGASLPFLVQLSLKLTAQVFAPGEVAPRGRMYIVHRGVALYGGKVYGGGRVWGEDVILTSEHLQKEFSARALCARELEPEAGPALTAACTTDRARVRVHIPLSIPPARLGMPCSLRAARVTSHAGAMIFLSVFSLSREDLEDVCSLFPVEWQRIRRAAITLATRRAFVAEAHKRTESKAKGGHGDGKVLLRVMADADDSSMGQTGSEARDAGDAEVRQAFTFVPVGGSRANGRATSTSPHSPDGYASPQASLPARRTPESHGSIWPMRKPTPSSKPLAFGSSGEAPAGFESNEASELRPLVNAVLANSKLLAEQMEAYEDAQVVLERTLNHQCTALTSISEDVHRLRQQVAGNTLSDVLAKLSLKA